MTKPKARKFFKAGEWIDAEAGTVIAFENQPVRALFYLLNGEAVVTIDGTQIATSTPGTFYGELTCFDGGPATATVTVTRSARLFRISSDALNALCNKDADLKMILENSFGADTRDKLIAANVQLTRTALAT
nr:cyclic nucleotide-binding domain-containing protein [Marivita sp. S6314]